MIKVFVAPIDVYGRKGRPLAERDLNFFTNQCRRELIPISQRVSTMDRKVRLDDKYISENNLILAHLVSRIEC